MVSFLKFITESKTVKASPKKTPKYNKGQTYERDVTGGLIKTGMGSVGDLSGRGNDAVLRLHKGGSYKLSIKANKGAAAGQIQFGKKPGGRNWEYSTKGKMGQSLVRSMKQTGGEGEIARHYGKAPGTRMAQIKRVREITRKKGELTIPVEGNRHKIARILRQGSNGDHLMHIQGKGTYAMTPRIARETGIDYIGDRIDVDSEPLTLRHRPKLHNSAKPATKGKPASKGKPATKDKKAKTRKESMTAQLNFNKDALEPSDHSLVLHGLKWKKD